MTIAAHISLHKNDDSYLTQSLSALALRHPGDHFIFFFEDKLPSVFNDLKNVTGVAISPSIRNSISLYYWYNFKLPGLLKRYDAEVFISNFGALSVRTDIKQFLFLEDASFLRPKRRTLQKTLLKYFNRYAQNAERILTTEKFIETSITEKFPAVKQKIFTVYHGIKEIFQPFSWEQKQTTTAEFTGENDYFLCYVSADTLPYVKTILKAFSIFKKWQKSSMQLVLLLDDIAKDNVVAGFSSYKYRGEVVMIAADDATTPQKIIASAYAALYFPTSIVEEAGLQILKCDVPLITSSIAETRAVYSNAALYAENDERNIAEKMQTIYKDEQLVKHLATNAIDVLKHYDADRSANDLWAVIADSR